MTYNEFVEEVGREFAAESFRMANLHQGGELNDWETLEIGLEHSRNGQSHSGIEPVVEVTPESSPSYAPSS